MESKHKNSEGKIIKSLTPSIFKKLNTKTTADYT
jgi:hypothetical protein